MRSQGQAHRDPTGRGVALDVTECLLAQAMQIAFQFGVPPAGCRAARELRWYPCSRGKALGKIQQRRRQSLPLQDL